MIVDSSALVAIALNEPPATELLDRLFSSSANRISAANLLETWMVVDRRGGSDAGLVLDDTFRWTALEVVPVTVEQVEIARDAWRRYGRGSGHRAQLNFGDCFAYALARNLAEPLLFVGNDFAATDIEPAISGEDLEH